MARDAEATKGRILTAAFEEFSERGFSGARVDDIAARAGCNKALLYQHYGDKERLFKHVLECKMAGLWEIEPDQEHFVDAAGTFFDFHAANPWVARLLQWEALNFGSNRVPNEEDRTAHFRRHVEQLRQAQAAGTVDPSLDPEQTLLSLIGLISICFMAPQTTRMVTGEDPRHPRALERRREHIMEMARRILEVKS
jgi:AcrR family transcriptional regulator